VDSTDQNARDRTDVFRPRASGALARNHRIKLLQLLTRQENAAKSFDELHSVMGVAKVGQSALPASAGLLDAKFVGD
jgi:hypothetical protein